MPTSTTRVQQWRARAPWLLAALVVAAWAALFASRLGYLLWDDDEAVLFLTARAVHAGHALYSEVWFDYPPGYVGYLLAAFRLGGASLETARCASALAGLVGLVAVAGLAARLAGRWAGLVALVLLATAPHFVTVSSAALAEPLANALAALGVWAAVIYVAGGKRRWLGAAGVACSLAVCAKVTMATALIAPGVALLLVERRWRGRLEAAALLAGAVVLPFGAGLLLTDARAFFHQCASTVAGVRQAYGWDLRENAGFIARYLLHDKYGLSHLSLLALPAAALWRVSGARRCQALVLVAWWVASAGFALWHTPLYRQHLLTLLYPLAALGGAGVVSAVAAAVQRRPTWQRALAAALLLVATIDLARSTRATLYVVPAVEADRFDLLQQAIDWVRTETPAGATILTDAPIIAIRTGRTVPLGAINTSHMRIVTHGLTDQQMINVARQEPPVAVIFWENKIDRLRTWKAWVGCHYDPALVFDRRHRLYLPASVAPVSPPVAVEAAFGDIRLTGYSVSPARVLPDADITLDLFWEATARPAGHYIAFTHLLDRDRERIAQHDGIPVAGACPTRLWQAGETFVDRHVLPVSSWLGAGGPYRLIVGWYDERTHERLSPDHLLLTTLP